MLPFQFYPFCHSPPSLFLLLLLHLLTSIAVSQQPCQPGSFLARNGSCLPCPPGTSQPQSAQTACVPCQGSEIAPEEGSAECTPCGVNELPMEHNKKCTCQSGSGRIQDDQPCKICPPGTFSEIERFPDELFCFECEAGTFQPNPGQLQCQACPPGSFSNRGAPECRSCPPGQVLVGSDCGTCPPGQRYDISELSCLPCDPGTFKATKGPSQCLPCPLGSFSATGATECITCPPGQGLIKRDEEEGCRSCPPGSFVDFFQFRTCQNCTPNTFQPDENTLDSCFNCAGNTFSLGGATECLTCGPDEALMPNGNCGRCAANSFYSRFEGRCRRCFFNSFSPGGLGFCTTCPIGAIVVESGSCELCPTGQAAMRSGGCGICPAGTSYDSNDGRCKRCALYQFQPYPNIAESCFRCAFPFLSNSARTKCSRRRF